MYKRQVQYETWRGKVTNFKNKPAFISPNNKYNSKDLHIEEINTTPQYSKMKINITNTSKEGMHIPQNAQIAKLELLDSVLQKAQEQWQGDANEANEANREETHEDEITDVKECDTCMCKIPNKFVLTDANGNNNHGLLYENIDLIRYRLGLQEKKAGLYIKHNVDPFARTVSLCPDGRGLADIKDCLLYTSPSPRD